MSSISGVLDATLCDKVCQWLAVDLGFSLNTPVSSTNKTDHHDVAEILLKVTLNPITPYIIQQSIYRHNQLVIALCYLQSIYRHNQLVIAEMKTPHRMTYHHHLCTEVFHQMIILDGNQRLLKLQKVKFVCLFLKLWKKSIST